MSSIIIICTLELDIMKMKQGSWLALHLPRFHKELRIKQKYISNGVYGSGIRNVGR